MFKRHFGRFCSDKDYYQGLGIHFFTGVKATFQKYLPGLNQGVMLKDGRKRFRETSLAPVKTILTYAYKNHRSQRILR